MTRADALLAGPRGRRVCLELLLGPDLWSSDAEEKDDAALARHAVFWAAGRLDPAQGVLIVMSDDDDARRRFVEPIVTPEDAAAAIERLPVPDIEPAAWRSALLASVDAARYWQAPDGKDHLAATEAFLPALTRVAGAVEASGAVRWWADTVDVAPQWRVAWESGYLPSDDPARTLAEWRSDAAEEELRCAVRSAAEPRRSYSGTWWSTPPAALPRTTRVLGAEGPLGLTFVEDSFGWTEAWVTRVRTAPSRVYEIRGAADWARLCRRHPLVVTASRRHDWAHATSRDAVWIQPDWAAVARDADAVHLTVAAYLETAGRVIELDGGAATVLAGWSPDETYWFRPLADDGPATAWERLGPTVWQPRRVGH